jgi:DNA-binding CsgD family transcriptional regulator
MPSNAIFSFCCRFTVRSANGQAQTSLTNWEDLGAAGSHYSRVGRLELLDPKFRREFGRRAWLSPCTTDSKMIPRRTRKARTRAEAKLDWLLQKVLAKLSKDERRICLWKRAGFSTHEIAKYQGRSVASVNSVFSGAKQKLRTLIGTSEIQIALKNSKPTMRPRDERRAPRHSR